MKIPTHIDEKLWQLAEGGDADAALAFLGRNHSADEARRAVAVAARAFPRLSIDLIYARPDQTIAGWRAELTGAIDMGFEHVSPYQLTIEPTTAFGRAVARGAWAPPDEDLSAALYEATQTVLEAAGFDAYEVSNHARGEAARSAHNLHVWRGGDYLGVGPGAHGRLTLAGASLVTVADGIGGCGEALLLNFALTGVEGCYGLGERTGRLNKLGDSADFLTVDVVAVFHHTYGRDDYDPTYVAIPLAIFKIGERFLGLFFDNAGRAVMDAGKTGPGEFWYQSFGGTTDLYLLAGPTLRDVARRYVALTGRAPLPSLWALGYHQCRWGYRSAQDLEELDRKLRQHGIPVRPAWPPAPPCPTGVAGPAHRRCRWW